MLWYKIPEVFTSTSTWCQSFSWVPWHIAAFISVSLPPIVSQWNRNWQQGRARSHTIHNHPGEHDTNKTVSHSHKNYCSVAQLVDNKHNAEWLWLSTNVYCNIKWAFRKHGSRWKQQQKYHRILKLHQDNWRPLAHNFLPARSKHRLIPLLTKKCSEELIHHVWHIGGTP